MSVASARYLIGIISVLFVSLVEAGPLFAQNTKYAFDKKTDANSMTAFLNENKSVPVSDCEENDGIDKNGYVISKKISTVGALLSQLERIQKSQSRHLKSLGCTVSKKSQLVFKKCSFMIEGMDWWVTFQVKESTNSVLLKDAYCDFQGE